MKRISLLMTLWSLNLVAGVAAPRPSADKVLVPLMTSKEFSKFITGSNSTLKEAEFTSVSAQVDSSDPKNTQYQFFFEYTKTSADGDISCNFTVTYLFDACSGSVGKLSAPIFTDLSCSDRNFK